LEQELPGFAPLAQLTGIENPKSEIVTRIETKKVKGLLGSTLMRFFIMTDRLSLPLYLHDESL
jgi:hypothetical protein